MAISVSPACSSDNTTWPPVTSGRRWRFTGKQVIHSARLVEALNGLGEVLLATGHVTTARAQHGFALRMASKIGDSYEQARAHNGLAHAYDATDDGSRARGHWRKALAIYARLGAPETDDIRRRLADSLL